MRFDVAAELAREQQRHEDRTSRERVAALVDVGTEAALLGAMLHNLPFLSHSTTCSISPCSFALDVPPLERCADVELDDFTDFRYRAIFAAIRTLQTGIVHARHGAYIAEHIDPTHGIVRCANGALVEWWPVAVADEIARQDRIFETRIADTVHADFTLELAFAALDNACWSTEFYATRLRTLAADRRLA
jgi:hypothetical protein